MKKSTKEFATSFTTFLFIVISITGVLMFFHILDNFTKEIHEILGLVFVVAAAIHVVVNFKAMKNYFNKASFAFSGVAVLAVSAIFILNAPTGPNPKGAVFNKLFNAPLEKSLTFFADDLKTGTDKLLADGLIIEDSKSIEELSKLNKTSPFRIISALTN